MTRDQLERLADEELMAIVDRKQSEAFEVLYDRHCSAAYSLAYRIVGDKLMAEDTTQDAFLSIWRSNSRYDRARGGVRSWVLTVVRNRAIDALRRGGTGAPRLDSDDELALEGREAPERTEEEVVRRETSEQLKGAIRTLPNDQSQVIGLAYFGGFSHSEIAEMLGLALGTVKGRMRLGLAKVRSQMAESIHPELAEEAE
ncbi:MAG: sigma-70 family RNA polymerase sigma factor [Solirubrobacterales bacterium]